MLTQGSTVQSCLGHFGCRRNLRPSRDDQGFTQVYRLEGMLDDRLAEMLFGSTICFQGRALVVGFAAGKIEQVSWFWL